jgi:PAS domain S-box-containing protein
MSDGETEGQESRPSSAEPLARRNRELEALYSISQTINASLDLDEVLRQALTRILELFEFPSGVLRLLEATTGELPLAASVGLSPELASELSGSFRVGDAPVGLAAQRRALVLVEDLKDSPYRESPWARHDYRTFVSVPLQCQGMLLGTLGMAATCLRAFVESDRTLLNALANQVGMAIANAELYASAQRRIQYLSALHQCSQDVGLAPDLDQVLRLTTERMAQLLRLDRTAVLYWQPESGMLGGSASYGFSPDEVRGLLTSVTTVLPARSAVQEVHAMVSVDAAAEGLLPEESVRGARIGVVLAVPLVAHDQALGLLLGDRGQAPLHLSADELELATIFANQAAVWINSARLLSREQAARATSEAAEARFRGLLESAPDGIVIMGREGRIALVNTQAEKMFGYQRDELLGQPIEILIPDRYRHAHVGHREGYISQPRTRPMGVGLDLLGRRKDGSEFPVEISLSPVQTAEGLLITSVIRDITDRKRAQDALARQAQELARSNAELEQFAYVASHDLQEPLRMVSSYTQLLAKRYRGKLDSDAEEFIGFAIDGVTRMQQLINDLLAYSRVRTRGKEFEPTDCEAVLQGVLANLQTAIGESGAVITHELLPVVMADAWQLTQLFQNLIANAIKFHGEEPSRVQVSAERDGNQWVFTVRDNGIGLEPEYAERIFLIFQRLHSRAEYPGTGIGLAICKRIVERHGGHLWVESQPGQGSTFFFTIPDRGGKRS